MKTLWRFLFGNYPQKVYFGSRSFEFKELPLQLRWRLLKYNVFSLKETASYCPYKGLETGFGGLPADVQNSLKYLASFWEIGLLSGSKIYHYFNSDGLNRTWRVGSFVGMRSDESNIEVEVQEFPHGISIRNTGVREGVCEDIYLDGKLVRRCHTGCLRTYIGDGFIYG